jgi:hypothetical protein
MFLTDLQTYEAIRQTLQASTGKALSPTWNGINQSAHAWAYNLIYTTLLARGFSAAQINAWDQGADYERDLTLYRAFLQGAALHRLDSDFIKLFDRSKALEKVSVSNVGVWQAPADTPGTVGTGKINTAGGVFNFDPDDHRGHDYGTHW